MILPTHKKMSARLIFSILLFVVLMSLDFYATDTLSKGNVNMEANPLASLWWKITGEFRHFDIPIWIIYTTIVAYLVNLKSEFFALWIVNGFAFGHLMGFLSWMPYGIFDFLYGIVSTDTMFSITISSFGIVLGLIFTLIQTKLMPAILK